MLQLLRERLNTWTRVIIFVGIIVMAFLLFLAYCDVGPLAPYDDCDDEHFRNRVTNFIQEAHPEALKIYPGALEVEEEGRDIACEGVVAFSGRQGNRYVTYYAWEDTDGDEFYGYRLGGDAPPGAPVLNEPTPTPSPTKDAVAWVATQQPVSNRISLPTPTRRVVTTERSKADLIVTNSGGPGTIIVKASSPMYQDAYSYLHSGVGLQSGPNSFALSDEAFRKFKSLAGVPSGVFGATPTATPIPPIPAQGWTVERLAQCNTYNLRRQMDGEEASPLSDCEVELFNVYMTTSETLANVPYRGEVEELYYTVGGIHNFLLDVREEVVGLNPNAVMNICRQIPEWERDLKRAPGILEKYQAQGLYLKGIEVDIIRATIFVKDMAEAC